MANRNVTRTWFDLELEIGDSSREKWRKYRCGSVTLNFGLNRIPSGTATLAIGRDASSRKVAPIHETAGDLTQALPVRIWLMPSGQWEPKDPANGRWTQAGRQMIFDGYTAGFGYRRRYGSTVPVLHLVHWLADLSFASILSDSSHPSNPAGFRWWAAFNENGTSTAAKTGFLPDRVKPAHFTPENIRTDLWGKSMHQMFADLADEDILWRMGADNCDSIQKANVNAQRALRRFETHSAAKDTIGKDHHEGAGSPYWKPLSFKSVGEASTEAIIARSINRLLTRLTLESYYNATVWDKIVGELSPLFNFALVPRVQTAMIVPFVPGLRQTFSSEKYANKVLDFQDLAEWETSTPSLRPLRAVGILPGKLISDTNHVYTAQAPLKNRLGGCYAPAADAPGMVLYRRAPLWLEDAPIHAHNPQKTLLSTAPASATTPMTFEVKSAEATALEEPQVAAGNLGSHYQNYAHYLYAQEMLRGRFAMVSGKLRFDLAPGTSVAIRNAKPLFLKLDALSKDGVATIGRVNISLDAESGAAGTAFQLDYIRTAEENGSDRTSIDLHPLYDQIFTGAPLLHEYLFP